MFAVACLNGECLQLWFNVTTIGKINNCSHQEFQVQIGLNNARWHTFSVFVAMKT